MISNEEPILKVSQVAKHIKMSADRLRTYDEENLVVPYRDDKNVRLYSMYDVEWLESLRTLIGKDKLSILGFKEILKLLYNFSDENFQTFLEKQKKDSIWVTLATMRKNPNYEKLRKFYD